jgi:hypothetical protein
MITHPTRKADRIGVPAMRRQAPAVARWDRCADPDVPAEAEAGADA